MVYWDQPYGLHLGLWDSKRISKDDIRTTLKMVLAVNTFENSVCIVWHHVRGSDDVATELEHAGFKDVHPIFWYKSNQMAVTHTSKDYIYAVESGTIGYLSGRSKAKWRSQARNPRERHNMISLPTQRATTEWRGAPLNQAEKPVALADHFICLHTDPGDTVLILGTGTGSEVIACLEAGRNCVAIELDPDQRQGAVARLRTWHSKAQQNAAIWEELA